jgi:hypothetical protein
MDADRLIFACATAAEAAVVERAGWATAARVGIRCANGVPEGMLVSFGVAGGLDDGLPAGTVIDASRVVDTEGNVLWEGEPLGIPGAVSGTIVACDEIVDAPHGRARLASATGALAADLESGPIARLGQLHAVVRAIGDTPSRPLGPLAGAVAENGRLDWFGLARAFASHPIVAARAAADARRALTELGCALESWWNAGVWSGPHGIALVEEVAR